MRGFTQCVGSHTVGEGSELGCRSWGAQVEGVTQWAGGHSLEGITDEEGAELGESELEGGSHTAEQGSCHSPGRCHTAGEGHTWGGYTYSQGRAPFRGDAGASQGRGL